MLTWSSATMKFTKWSKRAFDENGVRNCLFEPDGEPDVVSLAAFELGGIFQPLAEATRKYSSLCTLSR
jgi:hypothetical protein